MAITMGIMLLSLIFMLGLVEIGYLYWAKRDTQKVADLGALAGAQRLPDCSNATGAARGNAIDDNGFVNADGLTIDCGLWDPAIENEQHYTTPFDDGDPNAVRVRAERPVLPIFGLAGTLPNVGATAIASAEPLAAFSVGTTLLRFDGDSTLGAVLKGIGLDLDETSVLGYEGLAQIKITPGGLLKELGIPVAADIGVGELNTLLAGREISLGEVLDAIVTVAGQSEFTNANVALLNDIHAIIGNIPLNVQLGSISDASRGLFAQIIAPDRAGHAALGVGVDALSLIGAAIGVATSKHAITANLSALNLVTAQVGIVEPPSVAIGGEGATAYTAQVRSYIHIDTGELPLLGGLLSNVVRLNLPIVLDAVTGKGTLGEMCQVGDAGKRVADIAVDASILKVCIGGIDESTLFSTSQSCEEGLQNTELLNVLGLIRVNTKLAIDALPANGALTLYEGQMGTVGNDALLGTTVENITDAILGVLLGGALQSGQDIGNTQTLRTDLAADIWSKASVGGGTRKAKLQRSKNLIDNAGQNLASFVASLPSEVTDLLSDVLSLDILNLLDNVGGLVGGLLDTVGGILDGILDFVLSYDPCTGTIVLGIPIDNGSDAACKTYLAKSLDGDSGTGSTQVPNSVVATTGLLFNLLQPLLDGLGSGVLTPVLRNVLGLKLGETDVTLQSLECSHAGLVY